MQIRMAYALVVLLLGLLLVGYALPAPGAAAETPTPAAEVAATPPPEVLTVQVTGTVVNLRAGPGLAHEVQAQVQQGDELQVTGIHTDQAWLQVARAGPSLWISADLTDMAAERRHALPVVSATTDKGPTPTPTGGLVVGSTATPTPTLQPPQAAESPGAPPAEAELKGLPVTVTGAVVNVRAGPSRQHDVVSQVPQGTELPVTGISEDRQWLHTAPDGESRWIYADLTDMEAAVRQELVVVPVPPLTIEGAYDNRAAHWEGTYTLEQWSSTIGAVFSTTRSLVPAFAPPDPEILFTVPAGFRPALEIEWEIEGWPVSDEGVIEDSQSAPRLITVRVSTDGAVHYRDPAQVEGIEYVRYTARLAWPRAGTAPKVCERYFSIKRALVAILKMGDEDSPAACAGITWAQLATIKDLSDLSRYEGDLGYVAVRRAADLAGLQGLTTTKIWNIGSWPAGVLVPVPQLEVLHILSGSRSMDGPYFPPSATALPEDLLQYTPHLKDLRLEAVSMEKFRDGFLASVPRLRTLHIESRLPSPYDPLVWPDHIRLDTLLAPIPDLTELYFDLGTHTEIPPQMLASVPGLKTLTLVVPRTMAMPDHFPAGVPQLRHLTVLFSVAVQFPHLSVLPETFLTAVPQLESLSLGLGQMQYLPASFLAETPRLRQIRLGLLLKDPMEWLLLYERLAQLNEDWLFDPAFRLGHYNQVSVGRQQICATWGSRLTCWPGPGSPYTLARRYKAVAAGDSHTCGLTQDHRIECWDQNGFRHLETPAEEFQSVAVGLAHSCGVRTDSKVVCWGNNGHGQTDVPAGSYQAVAAGHTHSCGLRTDGTLVCWGDNRQGQSDPPTGEFREVTAGGHFSCALSRRARQVRCWGDNGVGQTDVPDNILKFRAHVESIDAGFDHACAVVAEVGIVCWGSNEFGQREGPSGNFGSVSAGYQASCALTSGGTRLCWGWQGRPVVQATGNAGTRPRGLAATGAPLVTYRVVAGKPVPISPVQGPSACPEQGPSPSLACDRELLLAIQESLELWVQPGREARRLWPAYVPAQDYEGVTVSGDPPRVSSVSLRLSSGLLDMPAHGTLPAALGRLSHLQHLDLSNNELTGPLPPELGQLARLESLNLARNQLTGALPPELGQLTQLVELYLQGNRLTGPLPPTLGQLTQLRRLWLSGNQLTGSLPSALGQLTVLVELNLAYNQLTGAIPPELGQLSSLERLDLYHNQLTGAIPPELGQLSDLPQLTLTHNQLTGAIPPELGQLSNLERLDLSHNQLTGAIPPELGQLPLLETLSIEHNQLTGSIQPALGRLPRLLRLSLAHNQLTGSLPPALVRLTELSVLNLQDNQLSGPIPPELGQPRRLAELRLADNQLTGPIPPELGQLIWLRKLDLAGNPLTGCLPPAVKAKCVDCPDLPLCPAPLACPDQGPSPSPACDKEILLALRDTLWEPAVDSPDSWQADTPLSEFAGVTLGGDPPRVIHLWLGRGSYFAEMSTLAPGGAIPPALGRLPWLQRLELHGNRGRAGPIPPELGQLTRLEVLDIRHNNLTGPIPPALGQLAQLVHLGLSANQLTGPIPPELGQLSELITLDLSANQLSGPIPVELDQIPRLKMLDLRDNPLTGCLPPAWRQDNYPIVHADPGEETYCAE